LNIYIYISPILAGVTWEKQAGESRKRWFPRAEIEEILREKTGYGKK
jgi:hypothetical protein